MDLTTDEKTLYAFLAVEIARHAGGQQGVPYWTASEGNCYEWGAWILRELGFASLSQSDGTPVPEGKIGPHHHLQHLSIEEIAREFADQKVEFDVHLDKLLETYIGLTGDFDSSIGRIPADFRPFAVADYHSQAMGLLVKCGYAIESGSTKYYWTDKIGPVFVESGDWPAATLADARKVSEEPANTIDREVDLMMDTMPRRVKKKLYKATLVSCSRVIAEHWYDDRWNFKELQKPKDYAEQNAELTKLLLKRIDEQGGIG